MDKINYFLKGLVLAILLRCTMNYLLPTPEKLSFKLLDGLIFGVLLYLLIIWFIDIFKKSSQK
ncbi:TPA: hypothetical protein PI338_002736 [Staphylococcus aureus]|uniref:hypothetical protein n=1 Tax=Staphylococcus epidermidis TaxID=1282 RepID=UPI0019316C09|nr:hypothetical protein [Staphylococcus epidermidis]HDH4342415.1 hypothetical protein [Staphylococcus aureus]HEQ3959472.1 hypothetical protein [Streptococcus pyogenes]MBM0773113.1 hypothetical protein [Staphylococcus epidermidis]MCG1067727.1 hypothetical protein [Staphylococcus epidermidis]HDH4408032.1 hypothetical protein [Staphylococcus aureus]